MTCDAVQKHLLGCERPDCPSAEASAHLAACAACREWHQRLVQLEAAVPLLAVPRADAARSALVRRILAGNGAARPGPAANGRPAHRPSIALVVGSWIMDPHAAPRRRVGAGLVAGVAAALLLFVTGWLIWSAGHRPEPVAHATPKAPPGDALLAELGRYNVKPREAATPGERVQAMADAAGELVKHADGRAKARNLDADEWVALADLYDRVVRERIVTPAEGLSAAERRQVLKPIADGLGSAESQWQQLSQQTELPPAVQQALAKCAVASREGKKRLLKLFDEAQS
jgi:hypothetical protein